jgi:hypothetical protein
MPLESEREASISIVVRTTSFEGFLSETTWVAAYVMLESSDVKGGDV